jgi:hypothetical protein
MCLGSEIPEGYTQGSLGDDCNDQDVDINPSAVEVCDDEIDNNCDGLVDVEDESCDVPEPPQEIDWAEDVVEDGVINMDDLERIVEEFARTDCGDINGNCTRTDVNRDGIVNVQDLIRVGREFGERT